MSDEPAALGPKPLEVRAVALSGTRRAVLAILLARTEPVSISVVASAIEGHDNSARAHLDALTDAGLAERTIAPAQGRGRPRYLYAAAPGSHATGPGAPTAYQQPPAQHYGSAPYAKYSKHYGKRRRSFLSELFDD